MLTSVTLSRKRPLILVPAHVNGQGPYEFILDTGAGVSLVSPELAHNLRIHATELKEGTGAGGKVGVSLGTVDSLAIGQARVDSVQVAITDELGRIGGAVGARIDGGIGYSYLKAFRLTIDYRNNTLSLAREDQRDGGGSPGTEIEFRLASPARPLILVPAFVNGQGPHQFVVDTGASTSVLSPRLAQSLGIQSMGACEATGGGGRVTVSMAGVRSFAVGAAETYNLSVAVSDFLSSLGQVVGTRLEGIVGNDYLKRFTVTIDYPREILGLDCSPQFRGIG